MQEAVQAKQISGITDRLLEAQRRREGRHTPEKKAQLAQYALPDYWVPLTQTKCIQTEAWFRDLLMPYNDKIWLLEPTVIPELPEDKAKEIERAIAIESLELLANGQELTEDETRQVHEEAMDEAEQRVTEEAKKRVKAMERLIQDQHEECDFRGVFRDFQANLDTYGTAFLYGPFTTVKKMPKWVNGKRTVQKKIIPTCSAPSPHDIFPAPWAKNENDGYIIERIRTYPQGLCDVKELDYYKTAEIDDLLRERDVLTASSQPGDYERNAGEDKQATPPDMTPADTLPKDDGMGAITDELKRWKRYETNQESKAAKKPFDVTHIPAPLAMQIKAGLQAGQPVDGVFADAAKSLPVVMLAMAINRGV
jgi:hypothetical protein